MKQYGGYVKYVENDIGRPKDKVHKHKERQDAKGEVVKEVLELENNETISISQTEFFKALENSRAGALEIPMIKPYHGTIEQRMMILG